MTQIKISEKEYTLLTEDEKRFYQRNLTKKGNYSLNQTDKNAGVKNFDKFHNAGYKGLYNGETADDIDKRKGQRRFTYSPKKLKTIRKREQQKFEKINK